ncbi:hypothetical protein [Ancylobacter terrae]
MSEQPNSRPPEDDPIELWGQRIGRGLAIVAGVGLVAYLVLTYLR